MVMPFQSYIHGDGIPELIHGDAIPELYTR